MENHLTICEFGYIYIIPHVYMCVVIDGWGFVGERLALTRCLAC